METQAPWAGLEREAKLATKGCRALRVTLATLVLSVQRAMLVFVALVERRGK